jgi:putative ABC transport system ATP-binding protein
VPLLDGPTSALDPTIGQLVSELTQAIAMAQSLTVIMVTHSMAQALHYGDRTLLINRGKIVMDISGGERRAMTPAHLLSLFNRDASDGILAPIIC